MTLLPDFTQIFLPCTRGFFTDQRGADGITAIRSFVNWFMLISLPIQSEISLKDASEFLKAFDQYKEAFREVSGCSLNIPKIHSLQHYEQKIRNFGTPDNFDTEYTEHQHIIDTKQPYRRTNKRDPLPQMIKHVQRRMVLENKWLYLDSLRTPTSVPEPVNRCSLGSRVKDCPILISSANSKYLLNDLELSLRIFLHNRLYMDGKGIYHRVKKRKLPELNDSQVNIVIIIIKINLSI